MNEIIARATNSINQMLDEFSEYEDISNSKLIHTRTLLNRLLEPHLSRNDWTRLLCRQLNRLLDCNGSLSEDFWNNLCDDIIYIIEKQEGAQNMRSVRSQFLNSIRLEEKLEEREFKFQQTFGKRKCLGELFCEHQAFFEEYLRNCILLHSKVQVQGLVKDLNDFLSNSCGLTESSFIQKNLKDLNEKLNCIEIPLNCSTRSLNDIHSEFFEYTNSPQGVNKKFSNFIPSIEPRFDHGVSSQIFVRVLESERWLVILGDPGSAKTSLLRWITSVYAETAHYRNEEMVLEENTPSPARIPILIRIGEFAEWLEHHRNKTLMDYIGQHTWFSQTYTHDDSGTMLREVIIHGHGLVLIDGLDEIPEIGHRKEIVNLVQKFIADYIHAPDFISVLDDPIFSDTWQHYNQEVIETQSPRISGGNQVLVTSRIVGYHLHPLNKPLIRHYSLSLMDHREAEDFVKMWMTQIEKNIYEILLNEGIQLNERRMKSLSKKRYKTMNQMFENDSKLLFSNPSLLSLICTSIFHSFNQFYPKSRVEVYNYVVKSAMHFWTNQEAGISKALLTTFLINLSTYLHLESPSNLIDAFDLQRLCCSTLQRQNPTKNRARLEEQTNKIKIILQSNAGIIGERGLEVFGFLHLSFQEYFVSQSFIKDSSIEEVTKRFLTFVINPRFRESLLMALGWISWKWSLNDYEQLCNLLLAPNRDYVIPFGTLLFFDAMNDLQRLPSNSIIFSALTILLDHPHHIIGEMYLISSLYKLSKDIIAEWMQLHLKEDERLSKFCRCLLMKPKKSSNTLATNKTSTIFLIYEQLKSFRNISTLNEFIIDQTFRKTIELSDTPDDILSNELSSYISSHNISTSDIHPLILSVITAVCGGIHSDCNGYETKINFSSKYILHQSSITSPIIKYLANNKEFHSTKIHILIQDYENVLEKALPSDTSVDLVDTFIALICLKGLSESLIYQKYHGYQALSLAFIRMKRTWFYLKKPFDPIYCKYYGDIDTSSIITSDVASMIKTFLSKTALSNEEYLSFSLACAAALNKLCTEWSSNSFLSDIFLMNNATRYLRCQPEFSQSAAEKYDQIANNTHPMQLLRHEPYFLLTFVPQSLQKLYSCMIINETSKTDSLPLVVFLSECLIFLETIENYDPSIYLTLSILQLQFEENMLENYAWMLRYKFSTEDCDRLINIERHRINNGKNQVENPKKDLQLFAASISLAQLFRSREKQSTKPIHLSTTESDEVHLAVMSISDPILRIIALSIILDMKKPSIFDTEQRDELRWKMISLLQSVLSPLPLLISTLLFIRCYTAQQVFPVPFQQIALVIGKKFNETTTDGGNQQQQEAAFIALQQLNNPDLSHYLSEFVQRTTTNLSDLLQFNSSIFLGYLTNTTYDTEDTVLLSTMYLTELVFDAQSLKMNTTNNYKERICFLKQWKQLRNDLSINDKQMTFRMATWITNNLKMLDKAETHQIIEDVSNCLIIERKALLVIEKWIDYRMNKSFRFFAHYAALQLLIAGLNIPNWIDIIIEIFDIDKNFYLKSLVQCLFKSELVDLTALRLILIKLNRNVYYFSRISIRIERTEILELILNLELERSTLNMYGSSKFLPNPFLSMIESISHDLQLYLVEHFHTFTNKQSEIENTSKEEYLIIVINWIIENKIWINDRNNFSKDMYEYIVTFLHGRRSPQIQQAVLNGLQSLFVHGIGISKEHVFLKDDVINNLEKIIYSYDIHSRDVLAICLLTYGNCLLQLKTFKINYDLTNQIRNILNNLFETSLSKTISIRAAFCLIISEQSSVTFNSITNWFTNKWNLTPENNYNILLQQTLYQWKDSLFDKYENKIVEHIETYSAELLDTFVLELYNYLYKQCNNNYISDPGPNYINIAKAFSYKNFDVFHKAVRTCPCGEVQFKRQLYLYHTKKSPDSGSIIRFYAAFGVITVELIEMLVWIDDTQTEKILNHLTDIKQVLDRDVIENLFEELDSTVYNSEWNRFAAILRLIVQLAEAQVISSFEVHQQISFIFNNLSHDENFKMWCRIYNIIDPLLNISCIAAMSTYIDGSQPLNENDINQELERIIQIQEKKSVLYLRRNYFFNIFRSIFNSSN